MAVASGRLCRLGLRLWWLNGCIRVFFGLWWPMIGFCFVVGIC